MNRDDSPSQPVHRGRRVGPYRLEGKLGAGGMGEVYRAFDDRLDRAVAIKRVNASFARKGREDERFWLEAKSIAKLRHASIIEIFDIVEDDDDRWIVMELIEGETLKQRLDRGPMGLDQALALFEQLAEALAEAHGHGVLHRDLKAENVMIDAHGRAKLLDFGLARNLEPELSRLTAKDRILGTPEAMSPEQALGDELDHRSDLFSLGSLLYRAVTGVHPFRDTNPLVVLQKVAYEQPPNPRTMVSELPVELFRLLDRLLEKDPGNRPQSAREVAETLAGIRLPGSHTGLSALPADFGGTPQRASELATLCEVPPPARPAGDAVSAIGERRQITLLQCELSPVGPGRDALDPEDVLNLRNRLTDLISMEASAFGGMVGQALDHGYLSYFGLPTAREDDARRAVYAARALISRGRTDHGLELRIGIHTGPVVVAPGPGNDGVGKLAFGETLARVAGVTSLAGSGEILISESTQAIAGRFFRLEPLETTPIPGLGADFRAYRDTGEDTPGGAPGDVPLIGREQQLLLLMDHWQLATEGSGQAVLMSGEAGIGKTRLVREVEGEARRRGATVLRCQCSSYERHTPFAPVVHLLRGLLSSAPGAGPIPDVLLRLLDRYDLPHDELAPFLGSLLGIPTGQFPVPIELSPQLRRQKTLEALVTLLLEMADRSPMLFVVEDLHWIDPSSQELIDLLIQHGPSVPILLLLTARPSFESPWNQRAHVVRMTLGRLAREHVEDLVARVSGTGLPPDLLDSIISRADGVPLFVEEITKAMTDAGPEDRGGPRGSAGSATLPISLQDFLMARLDLLGEAKVIAQHAAVLGRAFTLAELAAVTDVGTGKLEQHLQALVDAELVYRRGMGSALRFSFKHALVQDAAYQSLLKGPRRRIHKAVARHLEYRRREAGGTGPPPERLAYHFAEAGQSTEAIDHWLEAGRKASERSAHLEAAAHFEAALDLLARRPEGAERDATELELLNLLATARIATQGFGSESVETAYARAYELCRSAGDAPQLPWVLQGLWAFHETRAELPRSVEIGERILQLAEKSGDQNLTFEAHYALGNSHFFGASLTASRDHLEKAMAQQLPDRASRRAATGLDPVITSRAFAAVVAWHRGQPETALRWSRRALDDARQLDHPFSLAFAAYMSAWVHQLRGEPDLVLPLAEEVSELSERHGLFWSPLTRMHLGWATPAGPEAVAMIEGGLEAYLQSGARLALSYYSALLADAALACGDARRARGALDRALGYVEETGERFYLAELYHLEGEWAKASGSGDGDAQAAYRRGLELARQQGARTLELRLAVALSGELIESGEGAEARDLLERACSGFEEAESTGDWRRAQDLLATL